MTTIAFDGTCIASDTLAVDGYGLKNYIEKVYQGIDFYMAGAGTHHQIEVYWKSLPEDCKMLDVLAFGYPDYKREENNNAIMLVSKETKEIYKLAGSVFTKVRRGYHAIGSGRDYALAAMYCGNRAATAVKVAMEFDNDTGGEIIVIEV